MELEIRKNAIKSSRELMGVVDKQKRKLAQGELKLVKSVIQRWMMGWDGGN